MVWEQKSAKVSGFLWNQAKSQHKPPNSLFVAGIQLHLEVWAKFRLGPSLILGFGRILHQCDAANLCWATADSGSTRGTNGVIHPRKVNVKHFYKYSWGKPKVSGPFLYPLWCLPCLAWSKPPVSLVRVGLGQPGGFILTALGWILSWSKALRHTQPWKTEAFYFHLATRFMKVQMKPAFTPQSHH